MGKGGSEKASHGDSGHLLSHVGEASLPENNASERQWMQKAAHCVERD